VALARYRGVLTALPADAGPGTLFYRRDLLEEAGVTEAELTRSWESFIRAGTKVRAATGAALLGDATEIFRIYIRAGLRDGEGIYFGPDHEVRVTGPRFRRAFELARMAREAGVDAKIVMWTNEWAAGIKRGTIATLPTGSWMAWHLENWLAPDLGGLWRAAQLPGGAYASWGGSFLAIPKAAKQPQWAWEFIRFLCLDREQQLAAYEANATWPALLAAQDGPFVDRPVAYLGGQSAGSVWAQAAARMPVIALDRLDPVAGDIVEAELKEVLENGKDVGAALADAQRQIERRIGK
jgi:multiple sugar transport system substrate-binding protein